MALVIFGITMLFIYVRPFRIPLWGSAAFGAVLSLVFNCVNFSDVAFVWAMVWNSTFALVGLIIFALALEKLGFFVFFANLLLQCATNKKTLKIKCFRFYLLLGILSVFLSTFFANDGAILILTPLVLALFAGANDKGVLIIFLLFVGFLSDFASNAFVFSNLTNIITADFFKIPFLDFAFFMALPQIFAVCGSVFVFWLIFRKKLPESLEFSIRDSKNPSSSIILFCVFLMIFLLVGIVFGEYFGIPLSVFVIFVAFLSLLRVYFMQKASVKAVLSEAPFGVVVFSFCLFIVVYGVKNAGLVESLEKLLSYILEIPLILQIFSVGIFSSFLASSINNLPSVMLGDLALRETSNFLIFSHLLGCNIGAKLTPIGSLATLLWLSSLRRYGVRISFLYYMKIAFLVTIPTLLFSLFSLSIFL